MLFLTDDCLIDQQLNFHFVRDLDYGNGTVTVRRNLFILGRIFLFDRKKIPLNGYCQYSFDMIGENLFRNKKGNRVFFSREICLLFVDAILFFFSRKNEEILPFVIFFLNLFVHIDFIK